MNKLFLLLALVGCQTAPKEIDAFVNANLNVACINVGMQNGINPLVGYAFCKCLVDSSIAEGVVYSDNVVISINALQEFMRTDTGRRLHKECTEKVLKSLPKSSAPEVPIIANKG